MSELIERAKAFAARAHKGQTRYNIAKTPMMEHLEEVASLVKQSGGSEIEIAAAWLHDVIEDTHWELEEIFDNFGEDITKIVYGLTDLPEFKNLHTLEHKTAQARRVSVESSSVKRIRVADQISNVRGVAVDPPVRWDTQKCLDYVEGASLVVHECLGISLFLDTRFWVVYDAAIKAHAPDRGCHPKAG